MRLRYFTLHSPRGATPHSWWVDCVCCVCKGGCSWVLCGQGRLRSSTLHLPVMHINDRRLHPPPLHTQNTRPPPPHTHTNHVYTTHTQHTQSADAELPMMHMNDCLAATWGLMSAPREKLTRTTYNVTAVSFTPAQVRVVVVCAITTSRPAGLLSLQATKADA